MSNPSLPPLIDRELFFGNPEISGAAVSPDGEYIAFLKPWNTTRNVWVKKTADPFESARLLTAEIKRPIADYFWTRDGKYILYVKDSDGDENYNAYAVDPAAVEETADAPPSRDLTGLKGVQVQLYSVPKSDPDVVYLGLNDRDKSWHDLYKLTISTGQRTLIRQNTERIADWFFDLKGQLRLASRIKENGDREILRVDPEGFVPIYTTNVFEMCSLLRFHKDGKRVYIETNQGDDADLTRLMLLNVSNGQTEMVESDPLGRVDFGYTVFSEVTDELVFTGYHDDRVRRYFRDKAFEADYEWLKTQFPGADAGISSRTLDENLWLVAAHSDTEPGETYLFNRTAHTLAKQYRVREKLPRADLAPMQSLRYKSSDGLEIPAYLTLPKGAEPKHLPLLVIPHGGPWARDNWGYNPLAQFFANRGYAVLMANFRSSTGYGKKFLNAGNGEWGRKMQDDITWGVTHLVSEGVADPARVGILGGSYGGYAALAGVAFTPDVYRAAVDIVGPSNLITLLESIPPYWEAERKVMYSRMADPATPEGLEWLKERSPLNSADKITTPLLVVQGANDPRVNRAEAEQIVVALRDRGFAVEYICAPDEGHGFARPVNNMAMFMASETFLAKHLGGRHQEGGTPEVVERLGEITVDPKSVVLAKKIDASQVSAPRPTRPLQAGTFQYQAILTFGEQQMELKLSTTIAEMDGAWSVTEIMDTPMGVMTDTAVLDKNSLVLRKRRVEQEPMRIEVEYSGEKATGSMSMSGQSKPIAAHSGGDLFADGPGASNAIGCLALAPGYTTVVRHFDLQKLKPKLMELTVPGSEAVTVPAGTYEALKVELKSADGGADRSTVWIANDSRVPVKMVKVMAEMGGATLTSELLSWAYTEAL